MTRREFFRHWRVARQRASEAMASRPDTFYGRGLSTEGWVGGYLQALDDIDAVLRDVPPADPRNYWPRYD